MQATYYFGESKKKTGFDLSNKLKSIISIESNQTPTNSCKKKWKNDIFQSFQPLKALIDAIRV